MKTSDNQFLIARPYLSSSTYKVEGISNFSICKNNSYENNFGMGGIYMPTNVNGPTTYEVSFDRSFIGCDLFLGYTGVAQTLFFCYFDGSETYDLNQTYLTNYSVSFSVGELPKIHTKFINYNSDSSYKTHNIYTQTPVITKAYTNTITAFDKFPTQPIDIPKLNSIYISGDAGAELSNTLHSIYSIEYSIDMKRQPIYSIGLKSPRYVCLIQPLDINLTINSKFRCLPISYSLQAPILSEATQKNSSFNILVSGTSYIACYPIRFAKLVDSQISTSTQDIVDIKRTYKGNYGL